MRHSNRIAGGIAIIYSFVAMMSFAAETGIVASEKISERSIFRVQVGSKNEPIQINQIHQWLLKVSTPEGLAVENAVISISGGMPMHNHGLPTAPRVTQEMKPGVYLVEGMKFQMGGHWQVTFTISAGESTDTVIFELQI